MKQIIPINVTGGVSRTLYSHYYKSGWHDFDPTSPIPHTAILEIEIMEEPKILQVGSYSPSSACNAKVLDADGICPTLLDHKGMEPAVIEAVSCAIRGSNPENPSDRRKGTPTEQRLELGGDVANCLTSVQKDSMVIVQNAHGYNEGGLFGDFSPTVTSSAFQNNNFVVTRCRIRKLSPRECFRLQGMDDADIDKIDAYRIKTTLKDGTVKEKPIPKSQKYKMAGNSIVVDVLYHIFRCMFIPNQPEHNKRKEPKQLSLFEL